LTLAFRQGYSFIEKELFPPLKLKICLDTSVFSALLDNRLSDRQLNTKDFWGKLNLFEVATSAITENELRQTPDKNLRQDLLLLLDSMLILPLNGEITFIAETYIQHGVFTSNMAIDATHVASAVYYRQDVLVSWNFKHLVNRRRRAMVNQINVSSGWPFIEILAPPEL
jgi:predicted nucleic acid-binding protein